MKKIMIPAVAIAMAFTVSAFSVKKTAGAFYRYTSSLKTQAAITNINNYVRDDNACADGSDVCGVTLATDEGTGNPPDATEFSAESPNLWSSQQNGHAADVNISMKD